MATMFEFMMIQFNSIQLYFVAPVSRCFTEPRAWTPLVQAQWQQGQGKTSGTNLKQNHGTKGGTHLLEVGREEIGRGDGGGLCGRRGRETTGVVHSLHLVDVHNIYTDIQW